MIKKGFDSKVGAMTDMKKMNLKKIAFTFLTALLLMTCFASPSLAAKYKNEWVEKSDGYYYYYNAKGKKLKDGKKKIGKKYYYFDSKGRQLVGWRKINGKYYRFGMGVGKKGYMLKNQYVDRLWLDKKGRANVSSSLSKRTAEVLCNYTLWGDTITKPTWNGTQKLNAIAAAIKKFSYVADTVPGFGTGWDVTLAEDCYNRYASGYYHYECERYAIAFAYLAKAVGLKQVQIHIGGSLHGWVKISGNSYDPTRYAVKGGDTLTITSDDFASNPYYADNLTVYLYSVNN